MLTEPQSGIGDTQVKFARLIGRDQGFVVQASIKLPTGDEDMLAGSGAGDWSLDRVAHAAAARPADELRDTSGASGSCAPAIRS